MDNSNGRCCCLTTWSNVCVDETPPEDNINNDTDHKYIKHIMAPLSEYRRKFKQKGEACQKDYVMRYNYMIGRRSTEMSHTPLDWDTGSDTDSDLSTSRSVDRCSLKKGQEQVEVSVQVPSSNASQNGVAVQPESNVNDVAIQVDRGEFKSASGTKKTRPKDKCKCIKHTNDLKAEVDNVSDEQNKKRRDDKNKKERPRSVPKAKPPLLPYGWAYRGPIDNHKTFNVQVPEKQACPSALRAQKRRQLDIQKREEEKKHQTLVKKRTEALFNFVEKDKNGWMSEYQRNFSGDKFAY